VARHIINTFQPRYRFVAGGTRLSRGRGRAPPLDASVWRRPSFTDTARLQRPRTPRPSSAPRVSAAAASSAPRGASAAPAELHPCGGRKASRRRRRGQARSRLGSALETESMRPAGVKFHAKVIEEHRRSAAFKSPQGCTLAGGRRWRLRGTESDGAVERQGK